MADESAAWRVAPRVDWKEFLLVEQKAGCWVVQTVASTVLLMVGSMVGHWAEPKEQHSAETKAAHLADWMVLLLVK